VPKRVDHEERRRQIADALLRTAATRGLHATGMREVAAEAGVSLRLVQYYFGTKEELMLFAMQQLAAQFGARAMAQINKIKQAQDPVSPRDVIAAILTQGLPADDERRTFTILYTAYFALSLTEPALAIGPLVKNSNAVIDVVASQLRAAQAAGDTPAGLDPDLEALSLLTISAGLGTSILGGQSSPGQAQAVIDYHLDRLFPGPRPVLAGSGGTGIICQAATTDQPTSRRPAIRESGRDDTLAGDAVGGPGGEPADRRAHDRRVEPGGLDILRRGIPAPHSGLVDRDVDDLAAAGLEHVRHDRPRDQKVAEDVGGEQVAEGVRADLPEAGPRRGSALLSGWSYCPGVRPHWAASCSTQVVAAAGWSGGVATTTTSVTPTSRYPHPR
jgi:AcrR family transcriptional regulator